MLKSQEAELSQLKEDNKRKEENLRLPSPSSFQQLQVQRGIPAVDPSPSQLLVSPGSSAPADAQHHPNVSFASLTASQQSGLGRSYEEIGQGVCHQFQNRVSSRDVPVVQRSRPGVVVPDDDSPPQQPVLSYRHVDNPLVSNGEYFNSTVSSRFGFPEKPAGRRYPRDDEDCSQSEYDSEEEEQAEGDKAKKKGSRLGGLMDKVRKSFAFRKKKRDREEEELVDDRRARSWSAGSSGGGTRRKLDFNTESRTVSFEISQSGYFEAITVIIMVVHERLIQRFTYGLWTQECKISIEF